MSDRPPFFNPSYPAYPGPPSGPPGMYPSLPTEYRSPNPPYNPSFPGYPVQPMPPPYPAGPVMDFDRKGRIPLNTTSYPPRPGYPGVAIASDFKRHCRPPTRFSFPSCPPIHPDRAFPGRCVTPFRSDRYWFVPSSNGNVPEDAVHGGQDQDGGPIYVGRAYHEADILPAKICPAHGCAFVSYGGEEITKMQYEVLCSRNVAWTTASDGQIHPMAISVGSTADGEQLYVGRVKHGGTLTPGKIHPSHGVLYIPWAGSELSFPAYEVLINI